MPLDLPVVHGDDGTWGAKLNAALADLDTRVSAPGSGSLTPTAVKASAYTAAAGDYVPVDTSGGNVSVTLPTAPADKAQVGIKHVVRGGTNVVTFSCGGSDVINKAGGSTSGTITLTNQSVLLQYKASTGIWYVVGGDLPLSQLDSRFTPAILTAPLPGVRTKDPASTQTVVDSLPDSAVAPWLVVPPASVFAASGASAWYTANAATFMRFSLSRPRTFRYANLYVGTQSGNIQVGVVKVRPGTSGASQADYVRVASTGVIACPAAGAQQLDLGFFTLPPGEYALFLWCDNTTAQFLHGLATGITASRLTFSQTGLSTGVLAAFSTMGTTTRWVSGLSLEAGYLPLTALGDSITANDAAGVGTVGAWLSNADEQTGYRFYPISNNGVAGENSTQILARAAAAFSGKRYATILAGTNDIGQAVPAATVISNLQSIWSAAVSAGLQSFAVLTIPPRVGTGGLGTNLTAQQVADLKTVNAWIRANYTSYAGAKLADITWALSDGTDEASPLLANFQDGIHPGTAGSAIITGIVKKAMRDWA